MYIHTISYMYSLIILIRDFLLWDKDLGNKLEPVWA